MKLKDDVIKWREEVREFKMQVENFTRHTDTLDLDVKNLKEKVSKLVDITEEMSELMITLIRQQIGD